MCFHVMKPCKMFLFCGSSGCGQSAWNMILFWIWHSYIPQPFPTRFALKEVWEGTLYQGVLFALLRLLHKSTPRSFQVYLSLKTDGLINLTILFSTSQNSTRCSCLCKEPWRGISLVTILYPKNSKQEVRLIFFFVKSVTFWCWHVFQSKHLK